MKRNFTNTYVIETEDERIRYVGEADAIYFDSFNIRGRPVLRKFVEKKKKIILPDNKVQEFFSNISNSFKNNETQVILEYSLREDYNHNYFLWGGKICREYYWPELKSIAANRGILVSDDLLDKVFTPVEKQLMDLYLRVKNYGNSGKL